MKSIGIRVKYEEAEKVKKFLVEQNLLDHNLSVKKEENNIIFPIIESKSLRKYEENLCEKNFEERIEINLDDLLKKELSTQQIDLLNKSYDIVGDILLIDLNDELTIKQKFIGESLLQAFPHLKVIAKKQGIHHGTFRTQDYIVIAGENRLETIHKESGIKIKLNVSIAYFSPRLSTERKRIADLVQNEENILVMFSGVAPYVCVIAKNSKPHKIIGIEINPEGHKYGTENLKLNKIQNAELFNGDVNEIIPALNQSFDRILMPLPKSAEDFLDIALSVAKQGTIIHFYDFLEESKFYLAHEKIQKACDRCDKRYEILDTIKCGNHAPYVYRICVDFRIID